MNNSEEMISKMNINWDIGKYVKPYANSYK